jgi:DNA-binding CsgD family transcriptional regulator
MSSQDWLSIAASLGLTERELEVVKSVFEGGTEVLIARRLNLSSHTIHSHLDRVYKKLRVSNRCSMVVKVFAEYLSLAPHDEVGSFTLNAEARVDRQPPCEPAMDQLETLD